VTVTDPRLPGRIQAEPLDLPGIRHAFFTREGGVSEGLYASLNGGQGSGDNQAHVRENRGRMAAALGVEPDRFVNVHQVHSPDVVVATGPWPGERPKADGLVTRQRGLALAVASADCGPILFADGQAGVIGACHSGWKGAFTGVIESTLNAMEALGARRADTVAVLGPTISRAAYEVGPEFSGRFLDADPANARFFVPSARAGHTMFDLPAYIGARMQRSGIGLFVDLALCTYADERRFYSYRRTVHRGEPDYGRLIAAIALA
jgi:YfiH family protein